jgi:hypothetical protein
MSEIRLTIPDQYLAGLLNYLNSLNYVEIEKVVRSDKKIRSKKNNKDALIQSLSTDDPLLKAIKPIRKSATLEVLALEQNYVKTDWNRLRKLADDMAIQEPIEDLLAQLTP